MTHDVESRYALEVNGRLIGPTYNTEQAARIAARSHGGTVGIAHMPSRICAPNITYLAWS